MSGRLGIAQIVEGGRRKHEDPRGSRRMQARSKVRRCIRCTLSTLLLTRLWRFSLHGGQDLDSAEEPNDW